MTERLLAHISNKICYMSSIHYFIHFSLPFTPLIFLSCYFYIPNPYFYSFPQTLFHPCRLTSFIAGPLTSQTFIIVKEQREDSYILLLSCIFPNIKKEATRLPTQLARREEITAAEVVRDSF